MSESPMGWLLLLQLIFISLNALFASAEIAVITMNDHKLAMLTAAGDKRARRLTKLTEQPAVFLSTIQVGITLINLLSSAVATENFLLYAKDYFRIKNKTRQEVMKNAVQPAWFVPETVRTDVLFRNMKKTRKHFAVVVDDYGGMSGIITLSDLLEQIVGDIDDNTSAPTESPLIERLDSKTWRIQGTAQLDEVSKQLGVLLPVEDYDTFGGFVFGLLGTVPSDGSTPELEEYGLTIRVKKIKERRLISAVVCLASAAQNHLPD